MVAKLTLNFIENLKCKLKIYELFSASLEGAAVGGFKVMTTLSWTPCRRSSPSYIKIFLFFAALSVPTRASNMFAHRSSLKRTPNVTYIY